VHPTEAIFLVARCEIAQFLRNTMFFLDLTCPALKALVKDHRHSSSSTLDELVELERMIEDKYLRFCDPENPLHFMTMCTTRGFLAKYQLIEYHTKYTSFPPDQTEVHRSAATSYALKLLDCDTKLMTSSFTKGFSWLSSYFFPFPAYLYLAQDLKKRPLHEEADRAWEVMGENHAARFSVWLRSDDPLFKFFSSTVLEAWKARETASEQTGETLRIPIIVSKLRETLARIAEAKLNVGSDQLVNGEQPTAGPAPPMTTLDDVPMPTLLTYGNSDMTEIGPWSDMNATVPGQVPYNNLWTSMTWGIGGHRDW
jgi:hypothetical protein